MLFSVQMGDTKTSICVIDDWDDSLVDTCTLTDQKRCQSRKMEEAMKFIAKYAHEGGWYNFKVRFTVV